MKRVVLRLLILLIDLNVNGYRYDRRNFMRKMEASGFLKKMEVEDGRCCAISHPIEKAYPATRSFYVYSFNEMAFNDAKVSKEWRKYPFDF